MVYSLKAMKNLLKNEYVKKFIFYALLIVFAAIMFRVICFSPLKNNLVKKVLGGYYIQLQ